MDNIISYLSFAIFILSFFMAIFLWFKLGIRKAIIDIWFFAPNIKEKRIKVEDDKTVPLFNNTLEEENETSLLMEDEGTVLLKDENSEVENTDNKLVILEEIKLIGSYRGEL